MTRVDRDTERMAPGIWDCPRCGRGNRDRHLYCPNCRLERLSRSHSETPRGLSAPVSCLGPLPAPAQWDRLPERHSGPYPDAAPLAALAAVLEPLDRWLSVTRD